MSVGFRIPRLEVFSLKFEEEADTGIYMEPDDEVDPNDPTDVKGLCRILLSDGFRVCEIYNPVNVNDFFIDLQEVMQHSDSFKKGPKRTRVDSIPGPTDLPLMSLGPDGDIRPYGYFHLILHQDTGDELLGKAMPNYRSGFTAKRGAMKSAATTFQWLDYEKPIHCYFDGTFGALTLDCIVFHNSRLVTVGIKWLMDDLVDEKILEDIGGDGKIMVDIGGDGDKNLEDIGDGKIMVVIGGDGEKTMEDIGGDGKKNMEDIGDAKIMEDIEGEGKKNDATVTYICGNISFYGHAYEKKSILLDTPEDKVIKVEHGKTIRLLRSVIAIPYKSSFKSSFNVEASLLDPINNNFDIKNFASFDIPEENILHVFSRPIFGNGAKLEVEVSIQPNVFVQDKLGVNHTGEYWL